MANFFYLDASGQKQGPVNAQQLQALAAKGVITPDTPLATDTGHKGFARQISALQFGTVEPTIPQQNRNRKIVPIVASALILLVVVGIAVAGIASLGTVKRDQPQSIVQIVELPAPVIQESPAPRPTPERPRFEPPSRLQPQQVELKPGWTPEKAATIAQLKSQFKTYNGLGFNGGECLAGDRIRAELDKIDPIMVGKHAAFSSDWMDFIGPNKLLSQKQFEAWRDKVDITFESFEELLGKGPGADGNRKVLITAPKAKESGGHAHPTVGLVCINRDSKNFQTVLREIGALNASCHATMHEIAHIFNVSKSWDIDREGIVDVLIAYAMETHPELRYGGISQSNSMHWHKTAGTQHRLRRYKRALDKLKTSKAEAVNSTVASGSAHDYFLLGLVDKVGWEPYKQTFRSYNDKNFKPNEYERGEKPSTHRVRDFLDRIEHFSGQPGILRTLPDKGALLDKYFSPQVVQQNLGATPNESVAVKSSAAQTDGQ